MPRLSTLPLVPLAALLTACELVGPEVVVQNDLEGPMQIREISYHGCQWPVLLSPGEATTPCTTWPGSDQIHFRKFDAQQYFNDVLAEIEQGEHEYPPSDDRIGVLLPPPPWFPYQTVSAFDVDYGEYHVLHVRPDDIEQDFTNPGGHAH